MENRQTDRPETCSMNTGYLKTGDWQGDRRKTGKEDTYGHMI